MLFGPADRAQPVKPRAEGPEPVSPDGPNTSYVASPGTAMEIVFDMHLPGAIVPVRNPDFSADSC